MITVKEGYNLLGGDYEEVLSRLRDDERIKKYAGMFLKDTSYEDLTNGLENNDHEEAFRGAHSLKGVCMSLGFTKLYDSAFRITEILRGNDMKGAADFLPMVKEDYNMTIEAIQKFV